MKLLQTSISPFWLFCLGGAGALTCACLWSGWLVLSRLGLSAGIGIVDLMFLRYGVAMLVVSPFMWRLWPRHIPLQRQVLIACCSAGVPYALFSFAGIRMVEVAESGIFQNGFIPVMTTLFLFFAEGKRPSLQAILGMLVILLGCLALSLRSGTDLQFLTHFGIGHAYLLITAAIIGFYVASLPRWGVNHWQIIVMVPGINGIFAFVLWLFLGRSDFNGVAIDQLILQALYQGLGPSLLGVLAFFLAVLYFGKIRTASVMALVPALAALMAIPLLGEYPGVWGWLGIGLVSCGILLIVRQN